MKKILFVLLVGSLFFFGCQAHPIVATLTVPAPTSIPTLTPTATITPTPTPIHGVVVTETIKIRHGEVFTVTVEGRTGMWQFYFEILPKGGAMHMSMPPEFPKPCDSEDKAPSEMVCQKVIFFTFTAYTDLLIVTPSKGVTMYVNK